MCQWIEFEVTRIKSGTLVSSWRVSPSRISLYLQIVNRIRGVEGVFSSVPLEGQGNQDVTTREKDEVDHLGALSRSSGSYHG